MGRRVFHGGRFGGNSRLRVRWSEHKFIHPQGDNRQGEEHHVSFPLSGHLHGKCNKRYISPGVKTWVSVKYLVWDSVQPQTPIPPEPIKIIRCWSKHPRRRESWSWKTKRSFAIC